MSNTLSNQFKVLVVDDHPIFREGLVRIINQERDLIVCGEATDASEALRQVQNLQPDMVIADISMEGPDGIDLTKTLRTRFPLLRILVLSMHKESLYAERALRAGANGYIMKRENKGKFLSAIRQVLQGKTYVSNEVNEMLLQVVSRGGDDPELSPLQCLSDRELQVFRLIGQGYGTRQIAEELNLSMKTIESHREHIRDKLNFKNTFELVQYAIHCSRSELAAE